MLMTLCLGVFPASTAFACHQGKPHGKHTCDGGGGGGETPVLGTPTMASFMGPDGVDETNARLCIPAELTTTAGQYTCDLTEPVRVSSAGMSLLARKRDRDFCKALELYSQKDGISNVDSATPMTPDVYQFGWTDPCADGVCQIVVNMSFSGAAISAATGGQSDAVDIQVSGTMSGDLGDNPFNSSQELAMGLISAQFWQTGTTTIAAVCEYFPQSVQIGLGKYVTFASEPLPPPP
ncbi:MAG TPA: hypothetical protein VFG52_08575 [Xanthomonadales bacterium]|nr:hypothetical protein [Xanthomonadales bacterium]